MTNCSQCGAAANSLMMSSEGEVCEACFDRVENPAPALPPLAIAGLVAGAVPWVASVVVNGTDYVAVGAGVLAAGLGGAALVAALKHKLRRQLSPLRQALLG